MVYAMFGAIVFGLALWGGSVYLGVYVAREKGRSETEGALLGLFLGLFGCLIEALLPAREVSRYEAEDEPDADDAGALRFLSGLNESRPPSGPPRIKPGA